MTYDYAGPYKTLEAAQAALEDCYATGEVCEGERPCIQSRQHGQRRRYFVTVTYVEE